MDPMAPMDPSSPSDGALFCLCESIGWMDGEEPVFMWTRDHCDNCSAGLEGHRAAEYKSLPIPRIHLVARSSINQLQYLLDDPHLSPNMHLTTPLLISAFAFGVHARQCQNLTIPVTLSARNGAFNLNEPASNIDVTDFVLKSSRLGFNYTEKSLTGYNTINHGGEHPGNVLHSGSRSR